MTTTQVDLKIWNRAQYPESMFRSKTCKSVMMSLSRVCFQSFSKKSHDMSPLINIKKTAFFLLRIFINLKRRKEVYKQEWERWNCVISKYFIGEVKKERVDEEKNRLMSADMNVPSLLNMALASIEGIFLM